jgi:hypothetical protein
MEISSTSSQVDGNEEERRYDKKDQSNGSILKEEGNSRHNSVERRSNLESLRNIGATYLQKDQR